jgi:phosphoglycerate kinase
MEREVHALDAIVDRPARPLVTLIGGAQVREKFGLVWRFLELADVVCLGGAVCFPFLAALGHGVGRSLCPVENLEAARLALGGVNGLGDRLSLPKDLVLGRWGPDGEAVTRLLNGVDVPDGWMGLDIGPGTASSYTASIAAAATVFWNGPMGRFELSQFAAGTRAVADAVASTSATTVVGGGETAQALRTFGSQDRVNHLTAGGPAMREFLAGGELPGVQVLLRDPVSLA